MAELKSQLQANGIRSMMLLPIHYQGSPSGYIGSIFQHIAAF